MCGTDYQNQSNSFAGTYRQNASHVLSIVAAIRSRIFWYRPEFFFKKEYKRNDKLISNL